MDTTLVLRPLSSYWRGFVWKMWSWHGLETSQKANKKEEDKSCSEYLLIYLFMRRYIGRISEFWLMLKGSFCFRFILSNSWTCWAAATASDWPNLTFFFLIPFFWTENGRCCWPKKILGFIIVVFITDWAIVHISVLNNTSPSSDPDIPQGPFYFCTSSWVCLGH